MGSEGHEPENKKAQKLKKREKLKKGIKTKNKIEKKKKNDPEIYQEEKRGKIIEKKKQGRE